MNLELLKKLIKLANDNPNDNEANSAARKVCRMIGEDGYKLVGGDDIRRRPTITRGEAQKAYPSVSYDWGTNDNYSFWKEVFNGSYAKQNYGPPPRWTYEKATKRSLIPCKKCGGRIWSPDTVNQQWKCANSSCSGTVTDAEFHAYTGP